MESSKELHNLLEGTEKYKLFVDGEIGYVLFIYDGVVDFGQCMCCHGRNHESLGRAVKANREDLSRVILCGTDSAYNAELGVDATFDDLPANVVEEIKAKITAFMKDEELKSRREMTAKVNTAVVRKLIAEFRYEDARMHCAVTGLDFESFLEEARNRLDPWRLS